MKNIFIISATFMRVACQKEQPKKDNVTFSGTITNLTSDSLLVEKRGFKKVIAVKADGIFNDTLKVESGMFYMYDGSENTSIFLKNGYDLSITLDTKQIDVSLNIPGLDLK